MRELKFKQAIKEQSAVGVTLPFHWHYWGYLGNEFDGLTLPLGRMDGDERLSYQYTGMKDKEAKEIYEGDIIDYRFQGLKYALIVKWDNDCACFGLYRPDTLMAKAHFHYDSVYTEIIGNIYETPELLEAK